MSTQFFRKFTIIYAAIIVACVAHVAAAQPDPPPPISSFNLRVIRPDGEPIINSRVTIHVYSPESHSGSGYGNVLTDGAGRYGPLRVKDPKHPRVAVFVHAPEYGSGMLPEVMIKSDGQVIEVPLQASGDLRVTAHESKGFPKEEAGRPLGGAQLFLMSTRADKINSGEVVSNSDLDWMLPVDSEVKRVTRDGDGVFEMKGLLPGTYYATLVLPGYRVVSPNRVEIIEIKANQQTVIDFKMRPDAAPLEVTILDQARQPQANTDVGLVLTSQARSTTPSPELPSKAATAALNNMQGQDIRQFWREGRTDGMGRLTIYPLALGDWNVELVGVIMQPAVVRVTFEGAAVTVDPTIPRPQ